MNGGKKAPSSQFLETIVEHIPVMLSVIDAAGKVIWVNREVERVLGWSLGDVQ